MSGRKSRIYRSLANESANRGNVFKQGADGFMKWYRRLLAAIFPKYRRKYNGIVGWWYKRWLKKEARRIAAYNRDPDTRAFYAARSKARRNWVAKQVASYTGKDTAK